MSIESKEYYRKVFLNSDEWKLLRLDALARSGAFCRLCAKRDLHNDAHHKTYRNGIWNTSSDDLVILCRNCHELIHSLQTACSKTFEVTDEARFKAITDLIHHWMYGLGGMSTIIKRVAARHSTVGVSKKPKPFLPACKWCRKVNQDTFGRNILSHYGVSQSIVLWPFCDDCFVEFENAVPWPQNYKAIELIFRKINHTLYEHRKTLVDNFHCGV